MLLWSLICDFDFFSPEDQNSEKKDEYVFDLVSFVMGYLGVFSYFRELSLIMVSIFLGLKV